MLRRDYLRLGRTATHILVEFAVKSYRNMCVLVLRDGFLCDHCLFVCFVLLFNVH